MKYIRAFMTSLPLWQRVTHIRSLLLLCIIGLLSACTDNPACVDPDDFGFPKVGISAKGYSVVGEYKNQISSWKDTYQELTGDPLVIYVKTPEETGKKSRWNPWGDTGPYCNFKGGTMCPDQYRYANENLDIINPWCWMKNGRGLYLLVAPPDIQDQDNDPNSTDARKKFPENKFWTQHMSQTQNDDPNNRINNYNALPESPGREGGRLYFKINDTYYEDNVGEYQVVLKSGTRNVRPGPITTVIYYVRHQLMDAARTVYQQVVASNDFVNGIKALMVLYIMIVTMMFIFGMVQMTQGALAAHLIKIAILVALISPTSWNFFNNYLFVMFVAGVEQIITLVSSGLTGGAASGFDLFEQLLNVFTSEETNEKVAALIFSKSFGIFFAIMFYVVMVIVLIAIAKAVLLYLLSLIAIALLIAIAPVFIAFYMFNLTRDYFNRWMKQLYHYSLQPIVLFAFLTLMGTVLMNQLHNTLGFRVCWKEFWDWSFVGSGGDVVSLKFWQADIRDRMADIEVPEYFTNAQGQDCTPYQCIERRYVDLPYLDPTNEDDMNKINRMQDGYLVTFQEMLVFGVEAFLMLQFMPLVAAIARSLAGAANPFVNFNNMVTAAWLGGGVAFNRTANLLTLGHYQKGRQLVRDRVLRPFTDGKKAIQDRMGRATNLVGDVAAKPYTVGKRVIMKPYNVIANRFDAVAAIGTAKRLSVVDGIGRRIEGASAMKNLVRDQALNTISLGALGKNANAVAKGREDGKTNLDLAMGKWGKARGWDAATQASEAAKWSDRFNTLNRVGKIAVGVGLFAPPVGLALLGGYLAYQGATAYAGRRAISAMKETDATKGATSTATGDAGRGGVFGDKINAAREEMIAARTVMNNARDELRDYVRADLERAGKLTNLTEAQIQDLVDAEISSNIRGGASTGFSEKLAAYNLAKTNYTHAEGQALLLYEEAMRDQKEFLEKQQEELKTLDAKQQQELEKLKKEQEEKQRALEEEQKEVKNLMDKILGKEEPKDLQAKYEQAHQAHEDAEAKKAELMAIFAQKVGTGELDLDGETLADIQRRVERMSSDKLVTEADHLNQYKKIAHSEEVELSLIDARQQSLNAAADERKYADAIALEQQMKAFETQQEQYNTLFTQQTEQHEREAAERQAQYEKNIKETENHLHNSVYEFGLSGKDVFGVEDKRDEKIQDLHQQLTAAKKEQEEFEEKVAELKDILKRAEEPHAQAQSLGEQISASPAVNPAAMSSYKSEQQADLEKMASIFGTDPGHAMEEYNKTQEDLKAAETKLHQVEEKTHELNKGIYDTIMQGSGTGGNNNASDSDFIPPISDTDPHKKGTGTGGEDPLALERQRMRQEEQSRLAAERAKRQQEEEEARKREQENLGFWGRFKSWFGF